MGDKSAIHWTDATWNCLVGCSRVSAGCTNCYAEREAATRLAKTPKYQGLAREVNGHPAWTGEVRLWEPHLDQPLRWRAPRRIFVNSMSDLFHEKVPDEWLALIWGVMMLAERHTFQVLTKRPERMRYWLSRMNVEKCIRAALGHLGDMRPRRQDRTFGGAHIRLGVSVEDQKTADERIPLLLQTPAAVRWVSYEPALGPVWFNDFFFKNLRPIGDFRGPQERREMKFEHDGPTGALNWLVVGGESGHGARPFDLTWARSAIAQCRAAGVPVFVKQLGANPRSRNAADGEPLYLDRYGHDPTGDYVPVLRDHKGGDMAEWPEDLRVREYPR